MMNLLYANNPQDGQVYVVIPLDEYRRLTANQDDEEWEDVPYPSDEFDNVDLPDEIVNILVEKHVSIMAAWRIYRGLTQVQAAEKAGITQAALSQIEKKGTRPQAKTREQFAAIYDCSPDQLTLITP